MRILALVSDAFGGHGGIAKFNRDLLSALCAMPEVEQVVGLPRLTPESPGTLPAKLAYVTAGVGGKLRYGVAALKTAIASAKSQNPTSQANNPKRKPRFDLILCGHINLLPVAFAARGACRAPVVLVVHGIDAWQPTRSWLVNRLARRVDAVVAVSEFTRKRFCSWARPDRARSFILPNCVDLSHFTPGPKNPALLDRHDLRDRIVLLTVARLSAQERYKGIDAVLDVFPALAREIPNLSYLIVGDGTDRERLAQKAAALGLAGRVVFAGWVSNAETVEYYRLADAFVMPGRGEGFGIVYLEALACGVPVVASKADASAEVVRGCELATMVDPGDLHEIQTAVLRALQSARGIVPPTARHYSKEGFRARCFEIVRALNTPALAESGVAKPLAVEALSPRCAVGGCEQSGDDRPTTPPGSPEQSTPQTPMNLSQAQARNWEWWEQNPMTYDWEHTLRLAPGSREWFDEVDRRFLSSAYFARDGSRRPFGRFLYPELLAGKDVLEVGCGMGTHAALLARAGARLTAIDLTERAVQSTRRRFELFGLSGQIERADAEKLPFPDASFDFVWSWGVIHHSSRFEDCLAQIARVLRPGGRLMLMVYYRPCIVYYVNCGLIRGVLLGQLLRKPLHQIYVDSGDGFYARVFTRRELRGHLEQAFADIRLSVVGIKAELFPIPRTRFKEALESVTPDWLASAVLGRWGSMIVAEAVRK